MYAIVELSGKQYRVEKDSTINVNRLDCKEKEKLTIDKVLFLAKGDKIQIGQPYLSNVKVIASVVGEIKGKKVRGIKFKKRKNYTRTLGSRPVYTTLKINKLEVSKED